MHFQIYVHSGQKKERKLQTVKDTLMFGLQKLKLLTANL